MRELFLLLWRSIAQDRLATFGVIVVVLLVLVALLAPLLATHDPYVMTERVEGTALWVHGEQVSLEEGIAADTLYSVSADGPENYIAAGAGGVVIRYADGAWSDIETPTTETLRAISFAGGRSITVGHNGTVLWYGDGEFEQVDIPSEADLFGVSLTEDGTAVAVGADGTALHLEDGTWSQLEVPVARDLSAVALLEPDYGYAVGARGTLLRFDGESLEEVASPTFRDLLNVTFYDRSAGYAVGERGTVLRYRDGEWSEEQGVLTRTLRSIAMVSADEVQVVGTHGDMMRRVDGSWEQVATGYSRHFRGITSDGETTVVVGTDPYINSLARPSADHFFGTTHNGRDIYSQVIHGSRTALLVGFVAAVMVTVIGTNVGLFSGYLRGRTDNVLMRIVDIMYALPLEPFAMVLVLLWRPGIHIIILAVGLLTWRTTARIIRSQVLSLADRPFVKAARIAGASPLRIIYKHIAPNVLPLAFLQLAVAMAFAITAEATLSFLGLGPPRLYSWGTILHQARLSGAWRTAWWWVVPPGVLIMLSVVSVFFISRALEVIANPRLSRR